MNRDIPRGALVLVGILKCLLFHFSKLQDAFLDSRESLPILPGSESMRVVDAFDRERDNQDKQM